jgi:hypothetical protein
MRFSAWHGNILHFFQTRNGPALFVFTIPQTVSKLENHKRVSLLRTFDKGDTVYVLEQVEIGFLLAFSANMEANPDIRNVFRIESKRNSPGTTFEVMSNLWDSVNSYIKRREQLVFEQFLVDIGEPSQEDSNH